MIYSDFNNNNNIYLLKSQIYILNTIQIADTNVPLNKSQTCTCYK